MIYSDEELIEDMRTVAKKYGRNKISIGEYNMIGKFCPNTIVNRFGSWTAAARKAGLAFNTKEKRVVVKVDRRRVRAREVSSGMRFKILTRDNFKCVLCGASPATDPRVVLHVDHIVPRSKGGLPEPSNLRTLCAECNLGRGADGGGGAE
jgi:5-methylcytosine-specific restriction endonuclease McrA